MQGVKMELTIIFYTKKAPGKGGHHLVPFYPLTHPGGLSKASRSIEIYDARLNIPKDAHYCIVAINEITM